VILTPHNESIRYEFGARLPAPWRGWVAPSRSTALARGTAEITRYLASEYAASFQR